MEHGWIVVSDYIHMKSDSDTDMLILNAVERVHWLRAKAQFERWMEEQSSIYNEADWVPAYFHARSEVWRKVMKTAMEMSLKGHTAYASAQMHAWEELSQSSRVALSVITTSSPKTYESLSNLLS
jgi:hypothetical protein